jgi:flagellar biosynthesis protein FlhG
VLVLPGSWAPGKPTDCPPQAQERLLSSLRAMGDHAEFIVLDVGCGTNRVVRRFWHAADQVILVTTPEDASVMDAYAAIKVLTDGDPQLPICSLVNFAPQQVAMDVHRRLARVCQRFLGVDLSALGHLSASSQVLAAVRQRQAFVLDAPRSESARQLELLANQLLSLLRADGKRALPESLAC